MDKPTIYLAGPMTCYRGYNFGAFQFAARTIRDAGYAVVNPADFGANPKLSWQDCLKRALVAMMHQDLVVMLPGWQSSRGASLEVHVARELGLDTIGLQIFLEGIPNIKRAHAYKVICDLMVPETDAGNIPAQEQHVIDPREPGFDRDISRSA